MAFQSDVNCLLAHNARLEDKGAAETHVSLSKCIPQMVVHEHSKGITSSIFQRTLQSDKVFALSYNRAGLSALIRVLPWVDADSTQ